jgi:hypothetical protein
MRPAARAGFNHCRHFLCKVSGLPESRTKESLPKLGRSLKASADAMGYCLVFEGVPGQVRGDQWAIDAQLSLLGQTAQAEQQPVFATSQTV